MNTLTSHEKHGIQWIGLMQLDDLDFIDDMTLLSHTHELMQTDTTSIAEGSTSIDLNIHSGKGKILKCNTENTNLITLDGETLEGVNSSTHPVNIIDEHE
ncbi:unnamed protein product [Schistosoma mattheei]|uniref:Uncharacterized protein n=1 Tax=Schistosoma mattheei TaxID=31246 RepID=A0A183PI40_9TREM|nr:unnamed protein product [Schistosoma mattheei]